MECTRNTYEPLSPYQPSTGYDGTVRRDRELNTPPSPNDLMATASGQPPLTQPIEVNGLPPGSMLAPVIRNGEVVYQLITKPHQYVQVKDDSGIRTVPLAAPPQPVYPDEVNNTDKTEQSTQSWLDLITALPALDTTGTSDTHEAASTINNTIPTYTTGVSAGGQIVGPAYPPRCNTVTVASTACKPVTSSFTAVPSGGTTVKTPETMVVPILARNPMSAPICATGTFQPQVNPFGSAMTVTNHTPAHIQMVSSPGTTTTTTTTVTTSNASASIYLPQTVMSPPSIVMRPELTKYVHVQSNTSPVNLPSTGIISMKKPVALENSVRLPVTTPQTHIAQTNPTHAPVIGTESPASGSSPKQGPDNLPKYNQPIIAESDGRGIKRRLEDHMSATHGWNPTNSGTNRSRASSHAPYQPSFDVRWCPNCKYYLHYETWTSVTPTDPLSDAQKAEYYKRILASFLHPSCPL